MSRLVVASHAIVKSIFRLFENLSSSRLETGGFQPRQAANHLNRSAEIGLRENWQTLEISENRPFSGSLSEHLLGEHLLSESNSINLAAKMEARPLHW